MYVFLNANNVPTIAVTVCVCLFVRCGKKSNETYKERKPIERNKFDRPYTQVQVHWKAVMDANWKRNENENATRYWDAERVKSDECINESYHINIYYSIIILHYIILKWKTTYTHTHSLNWWLGDELPALTHSRSFVFVSFSSLKRLQNRLLNEYAVLDAV